MALPEPRKFTLASFSLVTTLQHYVLAMREQYIGLDLGDLKRSATIHCAQSRSKPFLYTACRPSMECLGQWAVHTPLEVTN